MRRRFCSADDVFRSSFADKVMNAQPTGGDRVLRSTRLENKIYQEHHKADPESQVIERSAKKQLSTFPALARDVFQSFYAFRPQPVDDAELSPLARQYNRSILEQMTLSDNYAATKAACSGRELPAYDAAREFTSTIAGELGALLRHAGKTSDILERQVAQRDRCVEELKELLQVVQPEDMTPIQKKRLVKKANDVYNKQRQVECLEGMVRETLLQNHTSLSAAVGKAMGAAKKNAEETAAAIQAWGSDPADPARIEVNRAILDRVRASPLLQKITLALGRMRETVSKAIKNGYAYGRGETYDLERGSNLQRVIGSEFALLAAEETRPIFYRKYLNKDLKQYRRREPVKKDKGDIIYCRDESDSVSGEQMAWGKAIALTMLGIAAREGRKFAFIHFAGPGSVKTELFIPGAYGPEDMLAAAELVLGGGTDFEGPLNEALRVIDEKGFKKADIIFATDGACAVSAAFAERFRACQAALGLTVTGLLMDEGNSFAFSLEPFCSTIYRTSELTMDEISDRMLSMRSV